MLKLKTEMEKFLYEERQTLMKERNEARKELEDLKQKSKATFSVIMYSLFSDEDLKDNGGYHHATYKATMIIKKDGITMTLDPEEIKEVVKNAGGNFNR